MNQGMCNHEYKLDEKECVRMSIRCMRRNYDESRNV